MDFIKYFLKLSKQTQIIIPQSYSTDSYELYKDYKNDPNSVNICYHELFNSTRCLEERKSTALYLRRKNHTALQFAMTILESTTNIQELKLPGNSIDDKLLLKILTAFKSNTSIYWIDISDNLITSKGLEHLENFCKRLICLEILILNNNKLDNNYNIFNSLFRQCGTVVELYLDNNNIDCETIRVLCQNIKDSACLKKLSLFRNSIKDAGAILIARTLNTTTINYLNLNCNKIGSNGGRILGKYLCKARSYIFVDLRNNEIDGYAKQEIMKESYTNPYFITVYL